MSLGEWIFSGSLLILLILAVRLSAKRLLPQGMFVLLWLLAALRLLLPVALPCRFSIWNLWVSLGSVSGIDGADVAEGQLAPFQPMFAAGDAAVGTEMAESGFSPLVWLWLAGTLLLAGWFLLNYAANHRRFRRAEAVTAAAGEELFARILPCRQVSLRQLDDSRVPLTFGLLRPVILLPVGLADDSRRLRCVLAHELMHIRWGHAWLKLLFLSALCLHWWNPLVWCMVFFANRDLEIFCDKQALAALGEGQRQTYAATLLELAVCRSRSSVLASGFGSHAIEERITAIMKKRNIPLPLMIGSIVVVLAITVVCATQMFPAPPPVLAAGNEDHSADLPASDGVASEQEDIVVQGASDANVLTEGTLPPVDAGKPSQAETVVDAPHGDSAEVWIWPSPAGSDVVVRAEFAYRVHPITGETMYHDGVDFTCENTDILAAKSGRVLKAGYDDTYGYFLRIDHGDGYIAEYRHCAELLAETGDAVEQGQVIAVMGATGMATGVHCHFGLELYGNAVDPLSVVEYALTDTAK